MLLRELQTLVDRKWPGAWRAARNQTGFVLTRIDSVELISCTELATLAVMMRGFQAYATMGPRTAFVEDGYNFEVWLMPHKKARTSSASRNGRKPKRKAKR